MTTTADRTELVGCGYCTHCGYGGEPVDICLHKRPASVGPVVVRDPWANDPDRTTRRWTPEA